MNSIIDSIRTTETQEFIRIPFDLEPAEIYNAVEMLKPCDTLPDFLIENIKGRKLTIFGEKHSSFYTDLGSCGVKVLKFNDILEVNDSGNFDVNRLTFRIAKGFMGNAELIVQKIIF